MTTTDGQTRSGRRGPSRTLVLPQTLTVKHLSELVDQSPVDVIKQLMRNGIMVSMNQVIDHEVASLVTAAYGIRTRVAEQVAETGALNSSTAGATGNAEEQNGLEARPPVVTILGHVDHGKTSLLDSIRNAHVADREIGGITQHIGAYQVDYEGQKITFLDTPGHEAFTSIRSRGARVTDIAILVVAADDGIMPQTEEAIDHARAAEVPIVVAINKMDLPGADPERVKRQLSQHNLLVEDWGGDIISVPVSARTGEGINELLENLLIVAEISELKANPHRPASGVVIEAKLDRKRGPMATVLVQSGTLSVGDHVVAGTSWGRVKAITNDRGSTIKEVVPGAPAELLGFGALPEAGDVMTVMPNEKTARALAQERERAKASQQSQGRALTLEEVVKQIDAGDIKELNLVLKADVQGSVEAVRQSLERLTEAEARVRILHAGSGNVTESDILLASASDAIIVGFSVGNAIGVERVAERMGVEIRHYGIIYQMIDDIRLALHGMLEPAYTDVIIGQAEVREIFASRRSVKIAGCRVVDGRIPRGASIRVLREGEVLEETNIASLRHFRDEANEVTNGMDCGILLEDYYDFEIGDILQAHRQERSQR
ncbi:Translation initiation factor IF-2 [Geodia barretti]|uniref:Translation initiation factor IF-2, chloroplastic n=3 Tax=Geodia barretti TaxID=519541 RepID=A0AA35RUK9_GEOBA|nr:Translation initiation factor IF-2 [Geodia barretti]